MPSELSRRLRMFVLPFAFPVINLVTMICYRCLWLYYDRVLFRLRAFKETQHKYIPGEPFTASLFLMTRKNRSIMWRSSNFFVKLSSTSTGVTFYSLNIPLYRTLTMFFVVTFWSKWIRAALGVVPTLGPRGRVWLKYWQKGAQVHIKRSFRLYNTGVMFGLHVNIKELCFPKEVTWGRSARTWAELTAVMLWIQAVRRRYELQNAVITAP